MKYEAYRTLAILGKYILSLAGELEEVRQEAAQPLSPLGKDRRVVQYMPAQPSTGQCLGTLPGTVGQREREREVK